MKKYIYLLLGFGLLPLFSFSQDTLLFKSIPEIIFIEDKTEDERVFSPSQIEKIDSKKINWVLPTDGEILSKFSKNSNFSGGILMGGVLGQSIVAASDGRVVYAGNGLIGYGQLIIIEHSKVYLSAYGYNQRIIVSEGDLIKKGQEIATMGLGPEQTPRLYFEVRRNTKPIDPVQFLSKS